MPPITNIYIIWLLLFMAASPAKAQSPSAKTKEVYTQVHFEYDGLSTSFLDGKPFRCLKSIWIEDEGKKLFYPNRNHNYELIKNNPSLSKILGKKESFLDSTSSLAALCFYDTTVWDKMIYDCDSLLKIYRKTSIDEEPFYAESFQDSRMGEAKSSYIYENHEGDLEIVFMAKMRVIEYKNCQDFITHKNEFEACEDCIPRKNESCLFKEVSDNFVVLDELISLEECDRKVLRTLRLKQSPFKAIIVPSPH